MARYKGKSVLKTTYDISFYGPLDTRMLVPTVDDLTKRATWTTKDGTYMPYNGMIVAVADYGEDDSNPTGIYYLFDPKAYEDDDCIPSIVAENWHKVTDQVELIALQNSFSSKTEDLAEAISANTSKLDGINNSVADFLNGRLESYTTKDEFNTLSANVSEIDTKATNLAKRVEEIVALNGGGEPNAINIIKVNGTALAINNKEVDISVPTEFSDLTDGNDVLAAIDLNKTNLANIAAVLDTKANIEDIHSLDDISSHIDGIIRTNNSDIDGLVGLVTSVTTNSSSLSTLSDTVEQYGIKVDRFTNAITTESDEVKFTTESGFEIKKVNFSKLEQEEGDDLIVISGGSATTTIDKVSGVANS